MKKFAYILSWIISVSATLTIMACLILIAIIQYYSKDLPDYSKLENYKPPMTTRLYSDDGSLLEQYSKENRLYMPFEKIPAKVTNAFISAEDKNFYSHSGVDIISIFRAALDNLRHRSIGEGSLAGGSTITQQVVKNFLLTREKSFSRKIKEAILAFRISKTYSKDRILELYLNDIYLGSSAYGVAAAAQTYFGKALDELSTEECAMLAAMPKAPSLYDPRHNYEKAWNRRNYVIGRMFEDNHINEAEAKRALQTPIQIKIKDYVDLNTIPKAPFFAEEVRRSLLGQFGEDTLYKGGLYVKTTLHPDLQKVTDQALRKSLQMYDHRHGYRGALTNLNTRDSNWPTNLKKLRSQTEALPEDQSLAVIMNLTKQGAEIGLETGKSANIPKSEMSWAKNKPLKVGDVVIVEKPDNDQASKNPKEQKNKNHYALTQIPEVNGAMVVMDPHTGKILAMSGGYSGSKTQFNRATQAKRQPGSVFKPFIYLSALEHGFTPTSMLADAPIELPQGPGLPMWRPKNYGNDYLGVITLRKALEKSRNLVTVRLAVVLGLDRVVKIAKRFAIYDELPHNFSVVLGSAETTLLRLSTAYSMIANGGLRVTPALIERIHDREGHVIFRRDTRECKACSEVGEGFNPDSPPLLDDDRERIIDPRVDYQIISMLQGVVQRGTAAAAAHLNLPIAGKTGTTNDSRDAWFIGFSTDYVVGIYVGYDKPKNLGNKETGGRIALPGFIYFAEKILKKENMIPFPVPEGISFFSGVAATGSEEEDAEGAPTITAPTSFSETYITGDPIFVPEGEADPEPVLPTQLEEPASIVEEQNHSSPTNNPAPFTPPTPQEYPTGNLPKGTGGLF